MVSTLFAQEAERPSGKSVAVFIPVTTVVSKVMSLIAALIATVVEAGFSKLYSYTRSFLEPTTNIFVPLLLNVIPSGVSSSSNTEKF